MALIQRKIQSIDNIFQNYAYQCLSATDIPGNDITNKLNIQGFDDGNKIKISYNDINDWNNIWLYIDFKNWSKYGLSKYIQLDFRGGFCFSRRNLKNINNIEGFTFESINKELTIDIDYWDFNIKSSNKFILDNNIPKFKNCKFISNRMDIRLYRGRAEYYIINEDGSIVTNKGVSKPILYLNDIIFGNSLNNKFELGRLELEDLGVHMFGKYPSNYLKTRYVNQIKQGKRQPDAYIEYPFNKNFEKRLDKQIRTDLNLSTSGNSRRVEIIKVDNWEDNDNSGIVNIR